MSQESGAGCKIDSVAEERGLTAMNERLEKRWASGESLRDLETFFNKTVLQRAMTAAGMDTIDGEPANLYRLLTDDAVTAGKRVDAESRLRRNEIDPESVVSDFVSYQTVRNHLNDCLGVRTARESIYSVTDARSTVHKLVSRAESVTLQTIERLGGEGKLSIVDPSVTVSVRVACAECNDEYTFSGLLNRGTCSCTDE